MAFVIRYGSTYYRRRYSVYGGNFTRDAAEATQWKTEKGVNKKLEALKEFYRATGRPSTVQLLRIEQAD